MNICSLRNFVFQTKILLAMRNALKSRLQDVKNSKGKTCLKVIYLTGAAAWKLIGKVSGFMYLDANGKDITTLVHSSLVPDVLKVA